MKIVNIYPTFLYIPNTLFYYSNHILYYRGIPIPISFMLYVFCSIIILIIGPVDHPNREVDSQENRIFIRRTHFTLLFSFLLAVIFAITGNTRYKSLF
ncbi:accessory gene regulator B family protein [Simiaoa sp.]|uniref:accessory gene regulator B family protein n=1 Tax=Simiaoa sp. TaxID=2944202 RepID=UPI003F7FFA95